MLIVVGRPPAPAGPNHPSPALAAWQTYSEPPPLRRDGIKLARARRTQRVHCTLALHCCTHCAQQVPDRDTDLGIDLTYETARRCLRVCTPVDGCSSAGRHHYYPAVPPGVLLEKTTRQQMLFCPRERMTVSLMTDREITLEVIPAPGSSPASQTTPHRASQRQKTPHTENTPLTGKRTPQENESDSGRETCMNVVEEISAVLWSRAGPRESHFSARCAALHGEPRNTVRNTHNTEIRALRGTGDVWRPGTAGNLVEQKNTIQGSPQARHEAEGFTRNHRIRILSDHLQSLPFRTHHLGYRPARGAGQEQGLSLAVTLKEHGKAYKKCRGGPREAQGDVEGRGCIAPPHQRPPTRLPPNHIGEVGWYSRLERQPQHGCGLDYVVDTRKDRCLCNVDVDARPVTDVKVTAVYSKYVELRRGKCCEATLNYSSLWLSKAELRCHIAYLTKLPKERRQEHRNDSILTIITEFNKKLFLIS